MSFTHEQFGRITPRELQEQLDGYRWREARELDRLAILATWIVNLTGRTKGTVEPRDLLGREIGEEVKPKTPKTREEIEQEKRDTLARFGEV